LSQLNRFSAAPDSAAARERAAYLLGDIGDRRAVEPLIAAYARETDRYIRLAVVLALGKLGDPRGIDTLIAALETPAWTPDYARIVDDLARIAGSRAIEPLIRVARSPGYTYGAAARAAQALLTFRATVGADPRVLDSLIAALRLDAEIATVQAVIAALAEIGDPRGAEALIALIRAALQLPAEHWDEREANLSENDQGVVFHVLKSHFGAAVAVVRKIGEARTVAMLEEALRRAPPYIPVN
jgi:HEAT repeat protein